MQAKSQKDARQVLPFMRATCSHHTAAHQSDMRNPLEAEQAHMQSWRHQRLLHVHMPCQH